MGRFQSGQMDQTVNLTSTTSVVRIHLFPPRKGTPCRVSLFVTVGVGRRTTDGGSPRPRVLYGVEGRHERACPRSNPPLPTNRKTGRNCEKNRFFALFFVSLRGEISPRKSVIPQIFPKTENADFVGLCTPGTSLSLSGGIRQ